MGLGIDMGKGFRGLLCSAAVMTGLAMSSASANGSKTWYVYCEGFGHGMHWAVLSENVWAHADAADYAKRISSAAETHFEAAHNVSLTGCSGIKFLDDSSAHYSRERTVALHRKMGDRVYFFPLPGDLVNQ